MINAQWFYVSCMSTGSLSNNFDFCCFSLSLYQNDTEIQLDFDDSITTKLIEILQHISFQICSAYTGIKIIFQEMNQITPSKFCFVGWKVEGHWFGSFFFFENGTKYYPTFIRRSQENVIFSKSKPDRGK